MLTTKIPFYQIIGKEEEIFLKAAEERLPVLLKGPTGSGKSRFLEYIAHKMNRRLITVLCNEETSATDLVGRYLVKGADTIWQDGPLTTAVKEGAIFYLDEIAESRPDTMVAIHSLTDHRRVLFIDRKNEDIPANPNFLLVASFNPGYQKSFKELKPSTRQRFLCMEFPYPKAELEEKIVCGETGLDASQVKQLVKYANLVRSRPELGLEETISTRLLVATATLIGKGLPPRLSARTAMILPITDDPDTVDALQESFNLYF